MVNRILELVKIYNYTPAQFADEIGVQRSAISHLVSGRNNPSLEFVLKILNRFPEINTNWLIRGEGSMFSADDPSNGLQLTLPVQEVRTDPGESSDPARSQKKKGSANQQKQIDQVILIYTDQTFRALSPDH